MNRRSLLSLTALLLAAQAQAPRSLDELWADFPRFNADTPLETEALKEWEQADVVCRIVRLQFTAPPANWQTVTELGISPCGEIVRDGERQKVGGKPWQGPRDVRNLRGEGGEHPRPTRQRPPEALLAPVEHQKAFNDAINKSLEQEAADRTGK